MTETDFTTDWLSERFRFDAAARNEAVEKACVAHFQNHARLTIVDIGSGHGSNFFYLSPKFHQHQEWYFVELNAGLLESALNRIADFAKAEKLPFNRSGGSLSFKVKGKDFNIRGIHASFLELDQHISLDEVDLVTAGAVFDLLSVDLFEQLAKQLVSAGLPLLSTINYTGMAFDPVQEKDNYFLNLYDAHMQREQAFGRSMGPQCAAWMLSFFKRYNARYLSGESNWQVSPNDIKMHQFLLNYLEHAIKEVLISQEDHSIFEQWLKKKKSLLKAHLLHTQVFHQDIFVHF